MAMNHGRVNPAKIARPILHRSLFQQAVGPRNHHDARPDAATNANPTGPFVSIASAIATQNPIAAGRESRRFSVQRQACAPVRRRARVASVVASFDSTTMIGAVANTSAASRPATGPNIRRPSHHVRRHVAAPATAEPNRAP